METQYKAEFKRLQDYAERRDAQPTERLGFGQDGLVYATNQESVLKCLRFERLYQTERNVYKRLAFLECDAQCRTTLPEGTAGVAWASAATGVNSDVAESNSPEVDRAET